MATLDQIPEFYVAGRARGLGSPLSETELAEGASVCGFFAGCTWDLTALGTTGYQGSIVLLHRELDMYQDFCFIPCHPYQLWASVL